jgi:hypothetical protein
MKLADRVIETHSAGVQSASGFTIAQTSKMFKILSDSLYSDKVMAVIRELSTNAYDSHVGAGNKNPFKVVLPTAANPNFSVRDYGTGLSQQDMESLYTTYGASNKNDSNDFVGCLGLGSKSPFAYTKSFTTSSYYNGMKHTYIAAIDDSGVPTLNLFNSTETDEPNGLEISFAVKQYDFSEFSQKAIRIFHYFKMKPIIEGGVIPSLKDHAYSNKNIIISGDGWRVCRLANDSEHYPSTYHHIDSGIVAIMGNIAYPVTTSQLIGEQKADQPDHIAKWNRTFGKADIDSWKSFITEILSQNLYLELDFNIGQLEMDVSREGLQYTKDVIKALRQKTQDIYVEMRDEFSKKISAAKTRIEAIETYYQMNDLAGGWGVGATWTDSKGTVHNINSGEDIEYKIPAGKSLYVFNYRSAGYRSRRLIYLTSHIHHNTITGKGESYWRSSGRKTGSLAFFVCDIKGEETAKKIVTRYCNEKDCFAYLMVDTKDHAQSNKGFDKLIEDIGSDKILKVSDYKDLIKSNSPRKNGVRSSKGSVSDQDVFFIYGASKDSGSLTIEYNDAPCLNTLTSDELEAFDDSDEIVYLPITRYAVNEGEGLPDINSLRFMFNEPSLADIVKQLFGKTKIYAIKNSVAKKMVEDGERTMIPFNTFFKDKLKSIAKDYFNKVSSFNGIVEFCKIQMSDRDNADRYYWNNYGDTLGQFSFHVLNLFGLDYKKFIKNDKLVNVVDNYLIMEFFSDTVHRHKYDINGFKMVDYYAHINELLNGIGIDSVDAENIKKTNVAYIHLTNLIINRLYVNTDSKEYIDLIASDDKTKYNLPKASELRKTMKAEVDNNPMLKYIMGTVSVKSGIRNLTSKNPIFNSTDSYNRSNDWACKMSDDMVDLLRIQLSSLIK